jgi:hypothetical protein
MRIRPGADVLVLYSLCIQNSLILHVIPVSIVGVDAKSFLNLVTSIRQPIHGPHPLIGRSSTSVNWIFISSLPFWMKPEEIFFPIFRRRVCSSS